jgi:2-oxoglutarate dehydrogenase E1 component
MNTYSLDYIDDLYVRYIQDPNSVSDVWKKYFEEFSLAAQSDGLFAESGDDQPAITAITPESLPDALWLAKMQERVDQLVREYRVRGHLMARIDPFSSKWA